MGGFSDKEAESQGTDKLLANHGTAAALAVAPRDS